MINLLHFFKSEGVRKDAKDRYFLYSFLLSLGGGVGVATELNGE